MEPRIPTDANHLPENFDDFFESSLCGFLIADTHGVISRSNQRVAAWVGCTADELKGKRFSDLLTVSGKIYYETHLRPLLRIQGFFEEIVLELNSLAGNKLRVLVNGAERRNGDGQPLFIRYTILSAKDRLLYEENLQLSKSMAEQELAKQTEMVALREQLIAVLGHDLRNPLSSISMAIELFDFAQDTENAMLLATLRRSSLRMSELVNNIMDFARSRLGEGIVLNRRPTMLTPVLEQVVAEMQLVHPRKKIITQFKMSEPVNCDSDRIAQLLSNLLANAITHGETDSPVIVQVRHHDRQLELSVSNQGIPIPENLRDRLFRPFTREGTRPSKNGLGLGLYICSEICRAHGASLTFTSSESETCFTFRMND